MNIDGKKVLVTGADGFIGLYDMDVMFMRLSIAIHSTVGLARPF